MARKHYGDISPDHTPRTCKYCPATIYFVTTDTGAKMPCDADGYSHFETCPGRDQASGQSRKAEAAKKEEQKYPGEVATSTEIAELRDAVGDCMQVIDDLVKESNQRHEKLRKWTTGMEKRMKKQEGVE